MLKSLCLRDNFWGYRVESANMRSNHSHFTVLRKWRENRLQILIKREEKFVAVLEQSLSNYVTIPNMYGFTLFWILDSPRFSWMIMDSTHLDSFTQQLNCTIQLWIRIAQDSILDSTINQDLRSRNQWNRFNHTSQIQFNSFFEPVLQLILRFIWTH